MKEFEIEIYLKNKKLIYYCETDEEFNKDLYLDEVKKRGYATLEVSEYENLISRFNIYINLNNCSLIKIKEIIHHSKSIPFKK